MTIFILIYVAVGAIMAGNEFRWMIRKTTIVLTDILWIGIMFIAWPTVGMTIAWDVIEPVWKRADRKVIWRK
jgi:hypothetical protein